MKPTLQDQLSFLTRTVNPNYVIIVQHKANENMDFSQFKTNSPEVKEKKVKEKRYCIDVIEEYTEVQSRIIVKDTWFTNKVVFDLICRKSKLEENLTKTKRDYKHELEKI